MPGVRPNVDIAHRQSKQSASDDWDQDLRLACSEDSGGSGTQVRIHRDAVDPNSGQ